MSIACRRPEIRNSSSGAMVMSWLHLNAGDGSGSGGGSRGGGFSSLEFNCANAKWDEMNILECNFSIEPHAHFENVFSMLP